MENESIQTASIRNDTCSTSSGDEEHPTMFEINEFWQSVQVMRTGGSFGDEQHQRDLYAK